MPAIDGSIGRHVRLRLVADPQSVPTARRFARDAVSGWSLSGLVEDTELCVSELTANAALHSGSQYIDLTLLDDAGTVSIVVDDHAPDNSQALIAASENLPDPDALAQPDLLASSGRGLFLVAALASQWGVEETATGKRIWARVTRDGSYQPTRPDAPPATTNEAAGPRLPVGWHMLRLTGCPVALALAHGQRVDDLVRELQLVAVTGTGTDQTRTLAALIEDLLQGQSNALQLGRHLLRDAAAQGMDRVDIEVPFPPGASDRMRHLNDALVEADELCRREQLLTLASTPAMVSLRTWVQHEVVAQVEHKQPSLAFDEWQRSNTGH